MGISNYLSEKIKILSFLLTVLIVILHANMAMLCTGGLSFLQKVMTEEVTRIAVPLFYLISGFLFFINYRGTWDAYKRKLCARTRSLLVPYLLLLFSGSIVMFVIGRDFSLNAFGDIVKNGFVSSPPIFYPLWFLRDLYIMVLLSPLVYWVIKKTPMLLIIAIVIWLLGKNPLPILSSEAILFFSVGGFMTTKIEWLERINHKGAWEYFVIWMILCLLNVYIGEFVVTLPYATHCLILLLGVYAIWILYDKLYPRFSESIKSARIYKYNFFIYLLHEPVLTMFKKTGLYVLGNSSWSIGIIYVIAPILTIFIVYGIGVGLNIYCPKVLAFITGGRTRR